MRIAKLTLRSFRGATRDTALEFDPAKPLVLVLGENGTGKSTIVDAIDLVCNRHCGFLDRSSATVKHLPSVGAAAANMTVVLDANGERWIGKVASNSIRVDGDVDPPVAHVLHRHRVTRLIEAVPSERFEQIRKFVEVGPVESCEETLNDAVKTVRKQLTDGEERCRRAVESLVSAWDAEGRPGGNALSWAAAKGTEDITAVRAETTALAGLLALIDAAVGQSADLEAASAEASEASAELAALEQTALRDAPDGMRLVEILGKVRELVAPPAEPKECPVCRNPIDATRLRAELDSRLAEMAAIADRSRSLAAARKRLEDARVFEERGRRGAIGAAASLAKYLQVCGVKAVADCGIDGRRFPALLMAEPTAHEQAAEQAAALVALVGEHHSRLAGLRQTRDQDVSRHSLLSRLAADIAALRESNARDADLLRRLQLALEIARGRRLAFTQGILDSVSAECGRLYRELHPSEGLGPDAFVLDENRKGSLHQLATFQGTSGIPPTSYFSDSHLDTLGLCLFLAIAKRASPGEAIVVIDDIFASVDAAHLDRVIDLLLDESRHFGQVIVTTHLERWFERATGHADEVQVLRLGPWDAALGIQVMADHA